MVTQPLSDRFVVLLQEMNTLLFGSLFILHGQHLELLVHFCTQLLDEVVADLSNRYFLENVESHPLRLLVYFPQLLFMHGHVFLKRVVEVSFKNLIRVLHGLQALVLADVRPA